MSTFFQARLIALNHASTSVFIATSQAALLLRVASAAKVKGAMKLSHRDCENALRAHFGSMREGDVASLLYETVFQWGRLGEKRLLSAIRARLQDPRSTVEDLVPQDKPTVASAMWLAQNLAHHFFPSAFVPILRSECAFEVRETSRDVRIPSAREVANRGSLAPQFASRLFRDAHRFVDSPVEDPSRNRWVAEFGWEKMAKPAWLGHPPLDAVTFERPAPNAAIIRTLSMQRWTEHLELERVFAAAG